MSNDAITTAPRDTVPGWRIFRSDAGRLWATRQERFGEAAEKLGAARTVDGDDWPQLCGEIAAQESLALLALTA
ncbi:hypothetical protein Sru01_27170 [Sphaerisporangium rufum]|uniref:Uncharacterized protein n=1 Tax=Sphaerisporangium rufum TaxID=1381558 RepID=A0A919R5T4_9ACTN|nr:hypothetical protein [Sphaerisporangium rufum]GII77735.1 hypothetical protein Sru01_27170 [Sphaerisporangium rufum]